MTIALRANVCPSENLVVIIREYLKYRNKTHAAQACFLYFDLIKDLSISIQRKHQMILKHFNIYVSLCYTELQGSFFLYQIMSA